MMFWTITDHLVDKVPILRADVRSSNTVVLSVTMCEQCSDNDAMTHDSIPDNDQSSVLIGQQHHPAQDQGEHQRQETVAQDTD